MKACLKPSELEQYLEGAASGALREKVERHLSVCARCQAAYERAAETGQVTVGPLSGADSISHRKFVAVETASMRLSVQCAAGIVSV